MNSPDSNPPLDLDAAAEPLRTLRRGLERARGFALFIAVAANPAQRQRLIDHLQEACPAHRFHTVAIRPDTTDILEEVLKQAPTPDGPIMVVGLENAMPYDTPDHPVLANLNLRRPEWRERIPQPVVFWITPYLLGNLGRHAPDFLDWRSDTVHFPNIHPDDLRPLFAEAWRGGIDTSLPVTARLERIRDLESRIAGQSESVDPAVQRIVAQWKHELGTHYQMLGRFEDSIRVFENLLPLAWASSDRRNEATLLGNLGLGFNALGNSQKAIECHRHSIQILHELGDRQAEGDAVGNLGNAYAVLGDARKALECHEAHLAIARKVGDRRGEGHALVNIGVAQKELGNPRIAIEYYDQALAVHREIGDRRAEGDALNNLGVAYQTLGDPQKAIPYYEQRLDIARTIGDQRGESSAFGNLGNAHGLLGDPRTAIAFHERSLSIAQEIGDKQRIANAYGNIGVAHAAMGDPDKAIENYAKALTISREVGDRRRESLALGNLGNVHANFGDHVQAVDYYDHASRLARDTGDPRGQGNWLFNMALSLDSLRRRPEANARAEEALRIYEQIESPHAAKVRDQLARWHGAA